MHKQYLLGLFFLGPAFIFIVVFFLAPVVLTGVFSFTNMSTATGITGGGYLITPSVLNTLKEQNFESTLIDQLLQDRYTIDAEGLERAEQAGFDAALLDELRQHQDQQFSGRREFERAIKQFKNRPASVRTIKQLAVHFEQSILNKNFADREALFKAVQATGVTLNDEQFDRLAGAGYTGWQWTFENFRRIFHNKDTLRLLFNTLIYVFFTLILFNTGFALVLAIVTFYLPKGQAAFFRGVWFLPRISPPVLYVLLWKWLAWDVGFISAVTGWFGIPARNWMLDTTFNAWVFVVLINGFVGASMGMILFSSAIKAIPEYLFYASIVDGANRWQQVKRIILPLLRWPILFTTSYQTLSLLTSFQYILLATDGGPGSSTEVWALAAYHTALSNYSGNLQYGYGAALALILVVIGIVLSLWYLRIFNYDKLVSRPRIEQ